jgi:hypothetical protein
MSNYVFHVNVFNFMPFMSFSLDFYGNSVKSSREGERKGFIYFFDICSSPEELYFQINLEST